MVAILADKTYSGSAWGQSLLLSLTERLRTKRIPFCEIDDVCPAQCETVFVIASDFQWTRSAVRQLNQSGRSPILLCNQYENLPGCVYSCVCSDVNASMKSLLDLLTRKGKRHLAVFGMNPSSISDTSRVNSLFSWKTNAMDTIQVFLNEGSLEACFEDFFPQVREFDAVICPNDFNAISLVRRLKVRAPEILEDLTILSCAESRLSEYYRSHITTLSVNYEQYGRAAVYIYETLRKKPYLSGMTLNVAWSFREDAGSPAPADAALTLERTVDTYYQDRELQEMLIADKLLISADSIDRIILEGLSRGMSFETIAEQCYLSESSVKYRIKRMLTLSNAGSRDRMVRILSKYTGA